MSRAADDTATPAIVQVHGSGTSNPSKFFWKTMDMFEEQSRTPIRMTYRSGGSTTGQKEFLGNGGAVARRCRVDYSARSPLPRWLHFAPRAGATRPVCSPPTTRASASSATSPRRIMRWRE